MQTLLVLVILISSWFVAPAEAWNAPVTDLGADACIREMFEGPFPHLLGDNRVSIECIAIDDVTAAFSNSSPVEVDLKVTGRSWEEMDRYGYDILIEQWRDGKEVFVSIYREIIPVSKAVPNLYEETIPLQGRFEAGTYTIHVNDYELEIVIPDAVPPGSDAPPLDDDDFPSGKLERHYAVIEDVDVIIRDRYPALVTLRVSGYHLDNCPATLQIDQRREGRWVFVEIYRLVDPVLRCPMRHTPLEEYIRLDGSFERGTYIIQVNDHVQEVSIPYPPPPPPPDERRYPVIENVEVLVHETYSYPVRLTLHVTGYHTDGCRSPLQIEQRRERDWVMVEIYRLVDPMIMCPEILVRLDEYIPLEGSFKYGTYVIQVNNYIFTYTIPPVPIYDDGRPPTPR